MRVIVLQTNLPKLKVGNLFLVTFKGGSLGREGNHDVLIPDINISKVSFTNFFFPKIFFYKIKCFQHHLTISYDRKKKRYQCVDLGSKNGTILNGARMSASQQESKTIGIPHGSVMELSQTKLLFHIHEGHNTCAECEPGFYVQAETSAEAVEKITPISRKEELKRIQKRYGLETESE